MTKSSHMDPEVVRARLLERQAELESMNELTESARAPVDLDQQSVGRLSRMDSLQQQAMAQANERQRLQDLQKIKAALKRLDEGEYGYCLQCGDAIAAKRLEVDPAAALCVTCAQ